MNRTSSPKRSRVEFVDSRGEATKRKGVPKNGSTAGPRPTARLRLRRSVVKTRGRGVVHTWARGMDEGNPRRTHRSPSRPVAWDPLKSEAVRPRGGRAGRLQGPIF